MLRGWGSSVDSCTIPGFNSYYCNTVNMPAEEEDGREGKLRGETSNRPLHLSLKPPTRGVEGMTWLCEG